MSRFCEKKSIVCLITVNKLHALCVLHSISLAIVHICINDHLRMKKDF